VVVVVLEIVSNIAKWAMSTWINATTTTVVDTKVEVSEERRSAGRGGQIVGGIQGVGVKDR